MEVTRQDRVRMERAHVLAWPATHKADINGWLWRSSGGGSQRANSVSTIDFTGTDLDAAIVAVEARYRSVGAPVRFQTFDDTSPPELAERLCQKGYRRGDPTITMVKRLTTGAADTGVVVRDHPWAAWLEVYLNEITESRRMVNRQILQRIPVPRAFFGYQRDGEMLATGLCAIGYGCAVIECVATRADRRRQGAARTLLTTLEDWAARQGADLIGLQVVTSNTPAIALYKRCGFAAAAANDFWVQV